MIEIKNLNKSFGNNNVLKNINLNIKRNETIAIIGPSGSGKSTLLRCLNLLEIPDHGEVRIDDSYFNSHHSHKEDTLKFRQKTAMVFQGFHLFQNKKVIDNIALPLMVVQKMKKDKALKHAEEFLDMVGLKDKRNVMPQQLSGGQQQRVAIARALALNPSVILFDEPTSALDSELVGEVLDLIKKVSIHTTSVIVTHEIEFARDVADRIVFIDEGQIIEVGKTKDILDHSQNDRLNKFLNRYRQKNII